MNRPTVWPWMRPFLILLVVIAIPPVVYWFGYVHSRTADERRLAYSTLSAITADFRNRLVAYDAIARSTDAYAPSERDLRAYLRSILKIEIPELTVFSDPGEGRLRVRPQTGDLLLLVQGVGNEKNETHAAAVPLTSLLGWEIVKTQVPRSSPSRLDGIVYTCRLPQRLQM